MPALVAAAPCRSPSAPRRACAPMVRRGPAPAGRAAVPMRQSVRVAAGTDMVAGPVTSDTWKAKVEGAERPVMVDFWAPWCGPCRMIAPLVDELAAEYDGKADIYKLNTDESPDVATELGIRSIPTVMLFKGGKKVETIIGAVPKSTLVQSLEKYI